MAKANKGSLAAKIITAMATAGTVAPDADYAAEAAKLAKRSTIAQLEAMLAEAEGRPTDRPVENPGPAWLVKGTRVFLHAVPPGASDEVRDGLPAQRAVVQMIVTDGHADPESWTARVLVDGEVSAIDVAAADLVRDDGQAVDDGLDAADDAALWALAVRWGIYRTAGKAKKAGREAVIEAVRAERAARKLVGWMWHKPIQVDTPPGLLETIHTPSVVLTGGEPTETILAAALAIPSSTDPTSLDGRAASMTDTLLATLPAPARLTPEDDAATATMADEPAPGPAPRADDPKVGDVLKKERDGVTLECRVVQGGYEYDGTTYPSLTAAASAACTKLGLSPKVNGRLWWSVRGRASSTRAPRPTTSPTRALEAKLTKARARLEAAQKEVTRLEGELRTTTTTAGTPPASA